MVGTCTPKTDYEFQYECNADGKLVVNYYNVSDCSDDPYYESNFTRATCVDDGSERMVGTCTPKTVTTMPTEIPTELPTVDPTSSPPTKPPGYCDSHDDCDGFCKHNHQCAECQRECYLCSDGVDGTCGSCGDGYPMEEDGPCNSTSSPLTTQAGCDSHDDCDEFCYAGQCVECSECLLCYDEVDGTCGSCGDGYPTEEDGPCKTTSSPLTTPHCNSFFDNEQGELRPTDVCMQLNSTNSIIFECNSNEAVIAFMYDNTDCSEGPILTLTDYHLTAGGSVYCDSGVTCDVGKIEFYDTNTCAEGPDEIWYLILNNCDLDIRGEHQYECDAEGKVVVNYYNAADCSGDTWMEKETTVTCVDDVRDVDGLLVGTCTPPTAKPTTEPTMEPTAEPTMDKDDTIVDETGTTAVPIPVPTPSPTTADINTGSVMRMSVVLPAIVGAFGYIFFF